MGSSFHFTIDLNEDQSDQPFLSPPESSLHHNHQQHHHHDNHLAPSNIPSSSYSLTPPSLSYLPFLINSHQDQVHVGYNNNTFHGFLDPHLSQPPETKKFVSNDGTPSSDQMVPKKKTRLKLTIRKKDNHHDHEQVRSMKRKTMITTTDNYKQHVNNDQAMNQRNFEGDQLKKISANQNNIIVNETGYNGGNNCMIRICSDCNTTKTPLWRSGPKGPKSLCNACGIRQRKARRAAMAAAATTTNSHDYLSPPLLKKKMQSMNKRSQEVYNPSSPLAPKVKKCKGMTKSVEEAISMMETQGKSTMSSSSSDKFYFDDLAMILSKSSVYQQVFPQDEKEAAILLMALSYGMVHG